MKLKNFKLPLLVISALILSFSCKQEKKEVVIHKEIQKASPSTWAERLGYAPGKKVIMLHADDVGMCKEANIATEKYLLDGNIQSAAIMIPCNDAKEFVEWAIANPKQDIGLHLTLTSEWKTHRWGTVTDHNEVPGLLDPTTNMWPSVPEVVMHASAKEVEKEIRAQIEQSIKWGYRPDHIDTHMGTLYGDPSYVEVYLRVAQEYGIPANAIDLSNKKVADKFKKVGYPINDEVIALLEQYSLPKLDNFTSVPKGKSYEEVIVNFKNLIKDLDPGLTEIIFHPSMATENLKSITNSWQQRSWEAQMFADKDLQAFFKKEGIVFTNWKEIMSRFKESKTK